MACRNLVSNGGFDQGQDGWNWGEYNTFTNITGADNRLEFDLDATPVANQDVIFQTIAD